MFDSVRQVPEIHAAAADGRDHGVQFAEFLDHLLGAGALPRDHARVVIGVHELGAVFSTTSANTASRLVVEGSHSMTSAIAAHGGLLGLGRGARHTTLQGMPRRPAA
jgi:hypothetical protein